jgi:hypothetical protein
LKHFLKIIYVQVVIRIFCFGFWSINFIWIAIHVDTSTKGQLDWSKLDETLRKISTTSSQINYFDEDEDLTFIGSNKNLLNGSEQTVYIVC